MTFAPGRTATPLSCLVQHYKHGHVTLVVLEESGDDLAHVIRVGGEDWTSLQNIIQAVFVSS